MGSIIIDRRLSGGGKNTPNRQKFLDRVRDVVREGVRDIVRSGNITDINSNSGKSIRVPRRRIMEPSFRRDGKSGVSRRIVTGNDRYRLGDTIPRPESGKGTGKGGSKDGEGTDSFVFHLTREEFLDIFFENCALPDLVKESMQQTHVETMQRKGFISDGSPSMLNITRSMRGAKARRSGLSAGKRRRVKMLKEQLEQLLSLTNPTEEELDEIQKLEIEIQKLERQIQAIPFVDPVDLKFNNWSKESLPATQAVMFCVMDVSGSMDQLQKELAKTFHILLMLFLSRNYQHIAIRFVMYHSIAKEVNEQEFYYGTETGGTVTSRALELVDEIVKSDYPLDLWNIYVAHCSDGDNWAEDNIVCEDILTSSIMQYVQYYAYIETQNPTYFKYGYGTDTSSLMSMFYNLKERFPNLQTQVVSDPSDVYPVFRKLFERKAS